MSESKSIRILTVDDHPLLRNGIAMLELVFEDLQIVGEASSGEEALEKCAEVEPDVVLMDVMMGKMDGIETTSAIKSQFPQIQVLILTSFCEKSLVERALNAGAIGFLLKDTPAYHLAEAIRSVAAGFTVLTPEAALVMRSLSSQDNIELTQRQQEILTLIVEGLTNAEIGDRLNISIHTVKHLVSQLLNKFKVKRRLELINKVLDISRKEGIENREYGIGNPPPSLPGGE